MICLYLLAVSLAGVFIGTVEASPLEALSAGHHYREDADHQRPVRAAKDITLPEKIQRKYVEVLTELAQSTEGEGVRGTGGATKVKINTKQEKRFIGLIIAAIATSIAAGVAASRRQYDAADSLRASTKPLKHPLGVAQIYYYREGTICSGTHLKPWIIVTTADCVYGRLLNHTYVVVSVRNNNADVTYDVQIKEIKVDPKYKRGSPQNNVAMVVIYGQLEWNVGGFHLPSHEYKTDDLIKKDTYVNQWGIENNKYYSYAFSIHVTKNYSLCGSLGDIGDAWYCIDRNGLRHTYNKADIGSPFFLYAGNNKYYLGLYTGLQLDKAVTGHLIQSVYPSLQWLEEQLHEHPIPPQ